MSTDLDQELDDSMKSSLESLFVSLREGPNMLNGFLRTWTAFSHTVQTHRDRLKEETLESIHNFAATIGTVAAAMLELEVEKEKMRDQLAADVSNILNDQMDNLFIEEERRDSEGMIIWSSPTYPRILKYNLIKVVSHMLPMSNHVTVGFYRIFIIRIHRKISGITSPAKPILLVKISIHGSQTSENV